MFLEPVMGEGDPGRSVPVDFYNAARKLTTDHGSLLLVDSIQAGLRANGVLSIIDYPGFENVEAPDMETYSKALNAGQYPLSVLAVGERARSIPPARCSSRSPRRCARTSAPAAPRRSRSWRSSRLNSAG